jgi:hypothetical protein
LREKLRKQLAVAVIFMLLIPVSSVFLEMTKASPNAANAAYYMSSHSIISSTTQYVMIYPAVYDGYLWIMLSNGINGGVPKLEKCDLITNAVISSVTLGSSIYEAFTPFVLNGLVFVPCIPRAKGGYSGLIILNETTLQQITIIQPSSGYGFVDVCYDSIRQILLIGQDNNADPNYSISTVPISQVTNASAYQNVEIAYNPDGNSNGAEVIPIVWNNVIYAVTTSPCNQNTGQIRTRLYSSTDLVTWTQVWEKTGQAVYPQCYFADISATSSYLAVGVLSGGSGTTTYRIETINTTGLWTEYNTAILRSPLGEDHPDVNALNDEIFLFETSARQGSSGAFAHTIYAFNATSQTLTTLFTVSDNGNIGYNDRWIGIDTVNKNLYVPDCINGRSPYGSAIVKIGWNLALSIPDYLNNVRHSAYLMLNAEPQANYAKGQQVDFFVTVLNQKNPRLETTLTLTITGPRGYSFYDFQPINVSANSLDDYSFNWVVPNVEGTYIVETSLAPVQLTAYDAKWLQAGELNGGSADSYTHSLSLSNNLMNEAFALLFSCGVKA